MRTFNRRNCMRSLRSFPFERSHLGEVSAQAKKPQHLPDRRSRYRRDWARENRPPIHLCTLRFSGQVVLEGRSEGGKSHIAKRSSFETLIRRVNRPHGTMAGPSQVVPMKTRFQTFQMRPQLMQVTSTLSLPSVPRSIPARFPVRKVPRRPEPTENPLLLADNWDEQQ